MTTTGPNTKRRTRLWVQTALGTLFTVLFLLTIIVPDWIEEVFGVDPDGGNGSLEWIIVAGCAALAAVSLGLARHEWRHGPVLAVAD